MQNHSSITVEDSQAMFNFSCIYRMKDIIFHQKNRWINKQIPFIDERIPLLPTQTPSSPTQLIQYICIHDSYSYFHYPTINAFRSYVA
jgi:hypothetical protein